ncbi:MAG: nucleotidyltransferase domain-containing protein [Tissierellaceae bacterium]
MLSVDEIKKVIIDISKKYGVKKVILFGSYARGDENTNSDIDLRIDKGEIKGLFELSGYRLDLEERLSVKVDVLTTESLSPDFLEGIKGEEIIIYEK